MRPTTIAIAAALAVSAAGIGAALRGPSGDEHSSEPAPAARAAVPAGVAAAAPPRVPASLTADPGEAAAPGDGEPLDAPPDGSTLQRELSAPERREAQAYPWEQFEAVLGRTITAEERDRMRDLRKDHGLRLAEARGRMQRGELPRGEFDAWRAARSSEFREEVRDALGCSPDEVAALLSTPMHQPGP